MHVYTSVGSVSYTHLDVYKRQALYCIPLSGWTCVLQGKTALKGGALDGTGKARQKGDCPKP